MSQLSPSAPDISAEQASDPVIIIGAGIIGIACAAYLVEAGHHVIILDRTGICEETSRGNAAAFAFSDVLPLAQKGMIRQLPRFLSDPLGPLTIPPAYLPQLAPWLWRFLLAGRSRFHESALQAQASLMQLAQSEWADVMERSATGHMLQENGSLELYDDEKSFNSSASGWDARARFNIDFEHVSGARLQDLQPGLAPQFRFGTFVPGWKNVSEPQLLGKALFAHAQKRGAHFIKGEVDTLLRHQGRINVRLTGGRTISAAKVVIAAGAWSRLLSRQFEDHLPLETERGYNTTLPQGAFPVSRQLTFNDHGFVITPLSTGLRIGGAVELGGLKRAPNYARSKAMLTKAARFLPGLKTENGVEWMGFRPSMPDSLPVISPATSEPNVIYAFGHGHLGLTQAAATGRLVRDLIDQRALPIDIRPFSASRF